MHCLMHRYQNFDLPCVAFCVEPVYLIQWPGSSVKDNTRVVKVRLSSEAFIYRSVEIRNTQTVKELVT